MGVQGLWELLAPVGRRVSVETIAGKKLAIDASIWMVQFMKAMRDDKGEMVRNAHLLGFFRRICKLLYLKTKPVFVFDGATPALKRRTVIARRRQRENAQAKIRKTAEKLLLNHLKQVRLKELAQDLESQRKNQKNMKGKRKMSSDESYQTNIESGNSGHETVKETSGESVAEKDGKLNNIGSTTPAAAPSVEDDGEEDEELILPEMSGIVDPDILAALPPSMQRSIIGQNDSKSKKILSDKPDQFDMERRTSEQNAAASASCNQEMLDQMLAASLMVEDRNLSNNNASTSAAAIPFEEDADEDEEMIFPTLHGNIDPAVLASLPPSMQLDLLVQMRERLMAENRQKYQRVKKAPEKFSELQIQSYLKTVAFRREIDEVQKAAAGRGVGGIQTSRIASEANREFIFSSSFTGDKQVLASARLERNVDKQQQMPPKLASDSLNNIVSSSNSNDVTALAPDEPGSTLDEDVLTYVDERGLVRVSRRRAMGIRMTRDLQRNLDFMKEVEKERTNSKSANVESILDRNRVGTQRSLSGENQFLETSHDGNLESVNLNKSDEQSSFFKNEASIEITLEDDGENNHFDADDDLFARLVAGDSVTTISSPGKSPSRKQSSDFDSDFDWEEDIVERKCYSSENDVNVEVEPSVKEGDISDGNEVEWEEGPSGAPKTSSSPDEQVQTLSKGSLEEEANLQEAIRRSLLDLSGEKSNNFSSEPKKLKDFEEYAIVGAELPHEENKLDGPSLPRENVSEQNELLPEIVDGVEKLCSPGGVSILDKNTSPERQSKSVLMNGSDDRVEEVNFPLEQYSDCCDEGHESLSITKRCSGDICHNFGAVSGGPSEAVHYDDKNNDYAAEPCVPISDRKNGLEVDPSTMIEDKKLLHHSVEITDSSIPVVGSSLDSSMSDICIGQKFPGEGTPVNHFNVREQSSDKSAIIDNYNEQIGFSEASLEEELLILDQERMNLGNEQRKLERNAESVSSEMFAECQELLQMFGLPYIIAPMEAEAQCAYMELANLVDGVVTDDSDVFLFGARSVYKNIFDDRKYVETYFMEDIEKELGLTREQLIRMALLLGSDYTEGISGIGIVNAIEVVNAFPEEDGLHKFREWIESPDPSILGTLSMQGGSTKRKRGSNLTDHDVNHGECNTGVTASSIGISATGQCTNQAEESRQSADKMDDLKQIFMDKHRNVSKNWHIPPSFPSEAVILAYSSPQVDKSTEPFTWGKPDLLVLRKLCWEKLGWGSQKSDELLLPVLKEYEKREIQLRLEAFYPFAFNERFAKIHSKRIKRAVKRTTGKQSAELMGEAVQEASKSRKKMRVSSNNSGNKRLRKSSVKSRGSNLSNSVEESMPKLSREEQDPGNSVQSEIRNPEMPLPADIGQNTKEQSLGYERGRGRRVQREKRKASHGSEPSETSCSNGNSGDNDLQVHCDKLEEQREVRRSARSRKKVNYAQSDPEIDEVGVSPINNGNSSGKEREQDIFETEEVCGDGSGGGNFTKQNHHEVPDPAVMEDICSDYLGKGGGFCTDEDPGTNNDIDPSFEDKLSKEYLKTGGGFCLDEDETNKDEEASCHPDNSGKSDPTHCFSVMGEAGHDIGSSQTVYSPEGALQGFQNGGKTDTSNSMMNLESQNTTSNTTLGKTLQEDSKIDGEMPSAGALSAMPYLKRKQRRKK
ncbi:hypothetical protein SLE2022_279920 [Rubroshorea leprosula]